MKDLARLQEFRLGDACEIAVGRDLVEDHFSVTSTDTHVYPVFSNSVENYGLYGFYDFPEHKRKAVTVVGRGAGLGTAFVRDRGFGAIGRLLVLLPNENVDPCYLAEYINDKIEFYVESSGIPQLTGQQCAGYKILLPSISEQRLIASALTSWNTASQLTEQLIAAKERHYSGLIGRLINGRSKSEAWQYVSIRDIADRVQRQGDGGDYPLLTISSASGFIRQEDRYSRYMAGKSAKTYTLLRAGEFSYNKGNSKRYEFGCVFQLQNHDAALVPSVYVSFKLHDSVCPSYMRHLFEADYLKPQLRALVKTGVRNNGLLNIRPDEFMGAKVPLPPFENQLQIANYLDAASAEIDLLKQQLAVLRTQKRGLMQKLLTGQWRLPISESAEETTHA